MKLIRWCVVLAILLGRAGSSSAAETNSAMAIDPQVTTLLDEVAAFFRHVTALQVTVQQTITPVPPDGKQDESRATLTFRRPAEWFVVAEAGGEPSRVYATATNLVIYYPLPNIYQKLPASSSAPLLQQMAPGLTELLSQDPKARILEEVKRAQIIGEEECGGVLCRHVRFEQAAGTVDVWFEKSAQPYPRRFAMHEADPQVRGVDVRYDQWQLNPTIGAGTFTFTPAGPDLREAESPRETTTVEPIRVPTAAALQRDYAQVQWRWLERLWLRPFRERVKGKPWEAAATAFVESALRWSVGEWKEGQTAELAAVADRLMAQGCDDVLALYLAAQIKYTATGNWRDAWDWYEKAMTIVEDNEQISRMLGRLVAIEFANIRHRGSYDDKPQIQKAFAWTREGLCNERFMPEEEPVVVRALISWSTRTKTNLDVAAEWAGLPVFSEWGRRLWLGHVEFERAWEARGGGWAREVTDAGWKGFHEHLTKARAELTQAWKLRPDRPEAAALMLSVVKGGKHVPGETERLWFDRAIAAQFDYLPAYDGLLVAYLPRWGGSHELMLAFGKACLDTRRFDTEVPARFAKACNDICSEREDWRTFYRRSEVAKPLMEMSQGWIQEPSRQHEKWMRQSFLAVNAWLAGDYALAGQTLQTISNKLHRAAMNKLSQYNTSPSTFLAEVPLLASPARADFERGEDLRQAGDMARARTAFHAALQNSPATAQPLVRARLAILDFEKQLATGDWTKLVPDPELFQWIVNSGRWSVEPDGVLVNHGTDTAAEILFCGRVGNEFELRGEIAVRAPENCCRMFGVIFDWHRSSPYANWLTCMVGGKGRGRRWSGLVARYYKEEGPLVRNVQLAPTNTFLVRSHNGKVTFLLNNQPMFTDRAPKEYQIRQSGGLIGFGAGWSCQLNTTRIRNVEVRLTPADSTK